MVDFFGCGQDTRNYVHRRIHNKITMPLICYLQSDWAILLHLTSVICRMSSQYEGVGFQTNNLINYKF